MDGLTILGAKCLQNNGGVELLKLDKMNQYWFKFKDKIEYFTQQEGATFLLDKDTILTDVGKKHILHKYGVITSKTGGHMNEHMNFITVAKCGISRDAEIIEWCTANDTFYKTEFGVSTIMTIDEVVDYSLKTHAQVTVAGLKIMENAMLARSAPLALPAPSTNRPVKSRGGTLFV